MLLIQDKLMLNLAMIFCLKYGPVAVDKLINNFKTDRCAFDFDYKLIMEA